MVNFRKTYLTFLNKIKDRIQGKIQLLPSVKDKKRLFLLVGLLTCLILLLIVEAFIIRPRRKKMFTYRNELSLEKEVVDDIQKTSSLLSFVRKGDIWLANINNGSNQRKITSHPEIKYKYRHFYGGGYVEENLDKVFHKQPKLSSDNKYLAYLTISKEFLKNLDEWRQQLATASGEIERSNLEFYPPEIAYDLIIYDIEHQKIIQPSLYNLTFNETINGDFSSIVWAKRKNVLAFIKDTNLHTIIETYKEGEPSLVQSNTIKDFCPFCFFLSDADVAIRPSPSGAVILSTYNFTNVPNECHNTVGQKAAIISLANRDVVKVIARETLCGVSIGDWYKDDIHFILNEYHTYGFAFFKRSRLDLEMNVKLFEDDEYQQDGPIILSPDDKWIIYPLGKHRFGSSGKVDLRIRNLQSNEYFDVLEIVNEKLGNGKDRILFPNWDFNSKVIYFELGESKDDNGKSVIKFYVASKDLEILIEDAEQVNVR